MSNAGVQFDLETESRQSFTVKKPKIVEWVMKVSGGMIKSETQANYFLLGFVAVGGVVIFIMLSNLGGTKPKFEAPAGYHIVYPQNAPARLEKI